MKKLTTTQKIIALFALLVLAIGIYVISRPSARSYDTVTDTTPSEENKTPVIVDEVRPSTPPITEAPDEGPKEGRAYYQYTLKTTNAEKELAALVGEDNVMAVWQTNRIDAANAKSGKVIVIPTSFDIASRSPFPLELNAAADMPKLLIFSQRVQAFGAYESGKLVRWGAVSSGKQSTKTPSGLFSTNWKGKEVKSSFDDEWILKYNFNINNFEGIGFHQYEMPGYPASHSCIRLLMHDAMWLYDWADQWILSEDGQTRLAHGTPVIVFGEYEFGTTAPWKLLPENENATDVTEGELAKVVDGYSETIHDRDAQRKEVLGQR